MKNIRVIIISVAVCCLVGCSRLASELNAEIDNAEKVMRYDVDSALTMLESINPAELKTDSLQAKYYYLRAYGHFLRNRSMIGDSLVLFAHDYYRGKNVEKDVKSGIAWAWYKFWMGDASGAFSTLDSLASLPNLPDSIILQTLRTRVLLGASECQGRSLIPFAERLLALESDSVRKIEAKYMLLTGYEYAGETDSALSLAEDLIDYARKHNWGDKHFMFELERAQLLTEVGRNAESDEAISDIFRKAGPNNGASDLLHFQYAVNALNKGDIDRASRHLAIADSIVLKLREDGTLAESYSNLLHAMVDFSQTGRISLKHVSGQNNRHAEHYNRMKASEWASEQTALRLQNRALALKAESGHKTVLILIISFVALAVLTVALWILFRRRMREREKEERIEALQKMAEEYKSVTVASDSSISNSLSLRNIMLKQLGIIKMVAETPTEQNREMLRKISSLASDTNGELVNWTDVFELIDNLYSGFYQKLQDKYGELLTMKEKQIVVLLAAGFSTKEIGVITGQTASTIYVRKSSVRKKLGVPEKEDVVAFLRNVEYN